MREKRENNEQIHFDYLVRIFADNQLLHGPTW